MAEKLQFFVDLFVWFPDDREKRCWHFYCGPFRRYRATGEFSQTLTLLFQKQGILPSAEPIRIKPSRRSPGIVTFSIRNTAENIVNFIIACREKERRRQRSAE